jgi:hypothetical protein
MSRSLGVCAGLGPSSKVKAKSFCEREPLLTVTEETAAKLDDNFMSGFLGTGPLTLVLRYPAFLPTGLEIAESALLSFEAQLEKPTARAIIERDFPIGRNK